MKLIIFDIDGTLTNTNDIDNRSFNSAFSDALNIQIDGSVWEGCEHITDLGLTHHIYQKKFSRLPRVYEVNDIKNRLIENFDLALKNESSQFKEVAGAVKFVDALRQDGSLAVAIATGCWKSSADFKLKTVGLDYHGIPLAHSDQLLSRREITLDAIEKSSVIYRRRGFDQITYIGDGVWDMNTSRDLKLNFVGIDCNRNGILKSHGVQHVFHDFMDTESLYELLV